MKDVAIESPVYHTNHVVRSLCDAAERYIQLFDRAALYTGIRPGAGRRAAWVLVADQWMQITSPAPDGNQAIARHLDQLGEHLLTLAFRVRGIDTLAARLTELGVVYRDLSGREVSSPVPRHGPSLHPRSGPTTPARGAAECEPDWWSAPIFIDDAWYEFMESKAPHDRFDPRRTPGWTLAPVVGDPLMVLATSHHTVVVREAAAAARLWLSELAAELLYEGPNVDLGTKSVVVRVGEGSGTVIELAEPAEPGPAARDLESSGRDVLHAINFQVADLDAVRRHLDAIGCPSEVSTASLVSTSPEWCHGARFGFTTRPFGAT